MIGLEVFALYGGNTMKTYTIVYKITCYSESRCSTTVATDSVEIADKYFSSHFGWVAKWKAHKFIKRLGRSLEDNNMAFHYMELKILYADFVRNSVDDCI